jgi:hypothetical protein
MITLTTGIMCLTFHLYALFGVGNYTNYGFRNKKGEVI